MIAPADEAPTSPDLPPVAPPDPDPASAPPPSAALRTIGLRRNFGSFTAVDGLNLNVREGSIYGFLGRNGAGKTTTIRMLMGILSPSGGEIELLGDRSKRTKIRQKRRIGYVSQEQYLYPWMTCRVLGKFVSGFYPTWDDQEYNRLLNIFELPAERKFGKLSGGMKMKLALSLALAHRPPLLILDEPTAGLDPVAQREFLEIISGQAREHGRTTFFSTHRIEEVDRIGDMVGIIDKGKMRYEGDLGVLKDAVRRLTFPADDPEPTPAPPATPPPISPVGTAPETADEPAGTSPYGTALPEVPSPAAAPSAAPPSSAPPSLQFREDLLSREGVEVLREELIDGSPTVCIKAEPELWASLNPPPGVIVESIPLEDIFIAYSGAVLTQI